MMVDEEKERQTPSVTPLPDSFHRARRNYVFVIGVLLVWDLMGIEIHEGNFLVKVTMKSPEGAYLALWALLIHFLYRYVAEWDTFTKHAIPTPMQRWDYRLPHLLATILATVVIFQVVSRSQLTEIVEENRRMLTLIMISAVYINITQMLLHEYQRKKEMREHTEITVPSGTKVRIENHRKKERAAAHSYRMYIIVWIMVSSLVAVMTIALIFPDATPFFRWMPS